MLPAAALGLVLLVDLVLSLTSWPIPILGGLDEVGHLLTAALLLAILPLPWGFRLIPWAMVGAVAIDIDHIPLYTFAPEFSVGGRPPSHSLVTVIVLIMVGLVIPALRIPFLGLALGVCLHFVRDVATGPGVALFWPVSNGIVQLPYALYAGVIAAAAAGATWRILRLAAPGPGSGASPA